jgi:hypothetical protein
LVTIKKHPIRFIYEVTDDCIIIADQIFSIFKLYNSTTLVTLSYEKNDYNIRWLF